MARRQPQFAASKFMPPAAASVYRGELVERLDGIPPQGVRVVVGPPGAGKTTLLAHWLQTRGDRGAWLNTDRADVEPVRFWSALITAVRTVDQRFAGESLDLLVLDGAVDADVLESLLDASARLAAPVDLVIDDFHLAGAQVHEQLRFLLGRGLAGLRLTIGSRAEPALGLDRLRLADLVTEIGEADLRFDRTDAVELLGRLGVELDASTLDLVLRRTEGWAAGLHLVAVALRDQERPGELAHRLTGATHGVAHYLSTELLGNQTPERRCFLLDTCVVDELTPELARALSPGTPVSLVDIEAANLLLYRVDPAGGVFRYHQLFAEMLRAHLAAHEPDHYAELDTRAARWFEARGDAVGAFRHRWRSGHKLDAIRAIHGALVDAYFDDAIPSLADLECTLDDDDIRASPGPAVSFCTALVFDGRNQEAARLGMRLEELADADLDDAERQQLLTMRMTAAAALGDTEVAAAHGERLLVHAERTGVTTDWYQMAIEMLVRVHVWRGDIARAESFVARMPEGGDWRDGTVQQRSAVAALRLATGELTVSEQLCRAMLDTLDQLGLGASSAATLPVRAVLGCTLLERGELVEAERLLRSVNDEDTGLRAPLRLLAKVALSRLWFADGHDAAALALIEGAGQLVRRAPWTSPLLDLVRRQQSTMLISSGQLDRAARTIDALADPLARSLCGARLAITRRDFATAAAALAPEPGAAATTRQRLDHLLARLALAVECELPTDALAGEVLDVAEPEGFVFAIAELGGGVLDTVRRMAAQRASVTYVERLALIKPPARAPHEARVGATVGVLSARERTVLRYLATSMSHREIADELYISVSTVKSHVKSIMRKLNARSRREVLARARSLRYL